MQTGLESQLLKKPLDLRGLWKNNKLHFDGEGVLIGNSDLAGPLLWGIEVQAVAQYRFKPALEAGQPVPIEMNGEVNFRLF